MTKKSNLKVNISVKDTDVFKQTLDALYYAYENADDDVKQGIYDRFHSVVMKNKEMIKKKAKYVLSDLEALEKMYEGGHFNHKGALELLHRAIKDSVVLNHHLGSFKQ